jgi:glucokinase
VSSERESLRVGVDLGGTAIKAGAISTSGQILERRSIPAELDRGPQDLADRIAGLARELDFGETVGIGVPGLLDREAGRVIMSANLHQIDGFALVDAVAERLEIPTSNVALENDANVAALGEAWAGAGREQADFLLVTLGTGVGGGIVLGGEIQTGTGGLAGEIGHICVDPNGPLCGCGKHGCLETLASATAASSRARELDLPEDLAELSAQATKGDLRAQELLHDVGLDLGRGLAAATVLLDLRVYVIGGGFGAALELLRPGIEAGLEERAYGRVAEDYTILPAELGPDAGWVGAARIGQLRGQENS